MFSSGFHQLRMLYPSTSKISLLHLWLCTCRQGRKETGKPHWCQCVPLASAHALTYLRVIFHVSSCFNRTFPLWCLNYRFFFSLWKAMGRQVVKRGVCVCLYIYIYCREFGLKTFEPDWVNTSAWLCAVRTKPIFLIHGLYVQGNCTRQTVSFFPSAHVNSTEWKICTREKMVALKLHESFWGAVPYLASSQSSPLFPLQGITWKQTTTDCTIACSSSLFLSSSEYPHFPLFDRSMILPKTLTATELPVDLSVSELMVSLGVPNDLLSFFLNVTFPLLERSWKKFSERKLHPFTSKSLYWHHSCSHASISKIRLACTEQNQSVYTQLFSIPFSYKFNCLEF